MFLFILAALPLISKPRNSTQRFSDSPWKACQSSPCPFSWEKLILNASIKGEPVSILTCFLHLATFHVCVRVRVRAHVCMHVYTYLLASCHHPVPPLSSVPILQFSLCPARFGLGFGCSLEFSVRSCFLIFMGLDCHVYLPACETFFCCGQKWELGIYS